MKLVTVKPSPFARKARVAAIELGLQDRVEELDVGLVTPVFNTDALNAVNPLGMIPALQLDDGSCINNSPLVNSVVRIPLALYQLTSSTAPS